MRPQPLAGYEPVDEGRHVRVCWHERFAHPVGMVELTESYRRVIVVVYLRIGPPMGDKLQYSSLWCTELTLQLPLDGRRKVHCGISGNPLPPLDELAYERPLNHAPHDRFREPLRYWRGNKPLP